MQPNLNMCFKVVTHISSQNLRASGHIEVHPTAGLEGQEGE
jgi:hypothetical protein